MFNKFKKIISILIIIVEALCFTHFAFASDWSYTIETSVGPKTIILPEGKSFEEAYIEMAKLYIEEKADCDRLLKETEELTQQVKEYEASSIHLEELQVELIEKNEEINKLYAKISKGQQFNLVATAGLSVNNTFDKIVGMTVGFGVELFGRWLIMADAAYPLSFTFRTGIRF